MADNEGFISSLIRATEVTEDTLVEVSTPDASSETGYASKGASLSTVAEEILNGIRYATELETTAKTIIGAINEAAQTGGGGDVTKEYVDEQNARQDADIETLYKLTQGQAWDFVDQTEHGMNVAPKGTQVQSLLSVEGKSEQKTTNGINISPLRDWSNTQTDTATELSLYLGVYLNGTPITSSRAKKIINANGNYSLTADFSSDDFNTIRIRHNGLAKDLLIEDIITTERGQYTLSFNVEGFNPAVVGGVVIKNLMLEKGSTAHDFEPYTGGLPAPNPEYPQEITSVTAINFSVEKDGEITTHTITPPHALNKTGDVADLADVVKGTWNKNIKTITEADFAHSIEREQSYFLLAEPVETPIDTADLDFLKSLQNMEDGNVITITDQNGNDITYAMKYLIKLSEAI